MKKKIIILTLIILFIVIILLVINLKNNKTSTNEEKDNSIENENNDIYEFQYGDLISEERVNELFNNSYRYYVLYEGREENFEGNGTFSTDGVDYYGVTFYDSYSEIEEMINNTFTEKRRQDYYIKIFESRDFMMFDNELYINYNDYCESVDVNFDNITVYKHDDSTLYLDFLTVGVYAYLENDNWYLDAPLHFCEETTE